MQFIFRQADTETGYVYNQNPALRHISTVAIDVYLLNFVLNPFLYCATNVNFMKFVMKLLKRICNRSKICTKLSTRFNTDLDISTNVSTMDRGGSSNNCPISPERVYSNMLTVPTTSTAPTTSQNREGKEATSGDNGESSDRFGSLLVTLGLRKKPCRQTSCGSDISKKAVEIELESEIKC